MLNTLLLIGGLALILAGANGLTDGSAAVAKRFRISDLVIGLTIVAFGTSAPELVISVLSALNGSAEMAIGNVVGSNIFNALMIIGCTALVLPIKVGEGTMSKEIPLVILSSLVLFVCANDMMLDRKRSMLSAVPMGLFCWLSSLYLCVIHLLSLVMGQMRQEKSRRLRKCLYGNRCCILQEDWPGSYLADSFLSTGQAGLPVHKVSVNR